MSLEDRQDLSLLCALVVSRPRVKATQSRKKAAASEPVRDTLSEISPGAPQTFSPEA